METHMINVDGDEIRLEVIIHFNEYGMLSVCNKIREKYRLPMIHAHSIVKNILKENIELLERELPSSVKMD